MPDLAARSRSSLLISSLALIAVVVAAPTALASAAPNPPADLKATAGDAQASISWTAPASDGSDPITSYTVTSTPDGKVCTTSGTTCVVTGLTNGTEYTFTATATASGGTSSESAASAAVTPTPYISFLLHSSRPTGDGVALTTGAAPTDVPTDYWVEYGTTSAYGSETAHQTVPAHAVPAGSEKELYFTVAGMPAGEFHVRLAARSYPTAVPTRSGDIAFATSSTSSAPYPACSESRTTECISSFTIDGARSPDFHAEVFLAGGGLQLQALNAKGTQELMYAGSPVTATSVVSFVVNAGSYDPGIILADAHVSTATIERTPNGTVITVSGSPQRTTFTTMGCRIDACGDDTTRGNDDYVGRMVASAFPPLPGADPAYVAASRGMWMSSNAESSSTPAYNASTGAVSVSLAAPHLTSTGEVNSGLFQAFIPTAMVHDLWKIDDVSQLSTTVSAGGQPETFTQQWTAVDGGWLLTLPDFHYSSPTISLRPTRAAAPSAPTVRLSASVVNAGERVVVTYTGTPGTTLEVLSKTQPATAYTTIRTVTLDAAGTVTTSHAPMRNTRIMARTAGGIASGQPLIQVRSVASLTARRVGLRTFSFTGRVYPAKDQRLVSLYRNGVLIAQTRTAASGIYSLTKTLAAGTFSFVVKTANDTWNLGCASAAVAVRIS